MHIWQEHLLADLDRAGSEQDVFDRLAGLAFDLGFDHFAYGVRQPMHLSQPRVVMMNNYPDTWQQRYAEESYFLIDPTVKHGLKSTMPLVWTEQLFQPERAFWEEARAYGLNVGWAQSSCDMQGVSGMLTLARSGETLTEAELDDKGYKMIWLTQITHQLMAKRLSNEIAPERASVLSAREIDVLRWTAEGKTASDIATIMHITERTANFHIANCIKKLNATNKTAAAVKAALLGLF
jgi:LuxR family quorum-sensing system transcriptional regulator SolR